MSLAAWCLRPGELLSLVNPSSGLGSENSGHDIDQSLEVEDKLLLARIFHEAGMNTG